jgi:predicted metal-dependent hydrolase
MMIEESVFSPTQAEITLACQGTLDPMVIRGLDLFNSRHFFEAHEVLESAWRAEKGIIREMYRGILQVSVGYFHLQNGNYSGARKMIQRAHRWLSPFLPVCRGINLEKFRLAYMEVDAALADLGPNNTHQFDFTLIKPIIFIIESQ